MELIGKKVRGFRFRTKEAGIKYNFAMNNKINEIGQIEKIYGNFCLVKFNEFDSWYYPIDKIKKHLLNTQNN